LEVNALEQIINWFVQNWQGILNFIAYVIAAASVVVKLTPTPEDDTVLAKVIDVLRKLALYKE
jgi:SepF-like predicted cell division protein (DUF552 family)